MLKNIKIMYFNVNKIVNLLVTLILILETIKFVDLKILIFRIQIQKSVKKKLIGQFLWII